MLINLQAEQVIEEKEHIFLHLSFLAAFVLLSWVGIALWRNILEQWLEVEPAIEALVLVFGLDQAQEIVLCQVFQLNEFSLACHLRPVLTLGQVICLVHPLFLCLIWVFVDRS